MAYPTLQIYYACPCYTIVEKPHQHALVTHSLLPQIEQKHIDFQQVYNVTSLWHPKKPQSHQVVRRRGWGCGGAKCQWCGDALIPASLGRRGSSTATGARPRGSTTAIASPFRQGRAPEPPALVALLATRACRLGGVALPCPNHLAGGGGFGVGGRRGRGVGGGGSTSGGFGVGGSLDWGGCSCRLVYILVYRCMLD
jgi:hypothetical protein